MKKNKKIVIHDPTVRSRNLLYEVYKGEELYKIMTKEEIIKEFNFDFTNKRKCLTLLMFNEYTFFELNHEVRFKKIYETNKFQYYVSNEGYILKRNKEKSTRKVLKSYDSGSRMYTYIEDKTVDIAKTVYRNFTNESLDNNFDVVFMDMDYHNCFFSNLKLKRKIERKNWRVAKICRLK